MDTTPRVNAPLLAGPHNARLGPMIHAFNLPATPEVCVGATDTCTASCYAKSFLFQIQSDRHRRNWERSEQADFVGSMIAEIRRGMVRVVRVHTSGDFYDPEYATKWARIAIACPSTAFFAYTRSWRQPAILPGLIDLGRLPNVSLWFSSDRDSGRPPVVPGVRQAYMMVVGESEASVHAEADLVFRVPLPRRPGRPNAYARPAGQAGQWRADLSQGAGDRPSGRVDVLVLLHLLHPAGTPGRPMTRPRHPLAPPVGGGATSLLEFASPRFRRRAAGDPCHDHRPPPLDAPSTPGLRRP